MSSASRNTLLVVLLCLVIAGIGYWWMGRGYGEVQPMTYELSTALYSACLKRNDDHLSKVVEMIEKAPPDELPENERAWLDDIVGIAKRGNWESAANKAKRMMQDQVTYKR